MLIKGLVEVSKRVKIIEIRVRGRFFGVCGGLVVILWWGCEGFGGQYQ